MIKQTIHLNIFTPLSKEKFIQNEDFDIDNFPHFPVLLNDDGSIWKHGSLYLLHKLKAYTKPSSKTLDSIAADLKNFKQFCDDDDDVDFLSAPRRVLRPTYLYREHLNALLKRSEISPNTLKRRMAAIVGFYKYLIEVEGISFKYPLWESGITSISYKDRHGFKQVKQVETKDVSRVPSTSNPDLFDEAILDGGKLRPLTKEEQIELLSALKEIGNTEMTLSFLIALTTGARIQTVFTLRLKHFAPVQKEHKGDVRVKVGYGTSCDTKYMKQHTLVFPRWLYDKIRTYIHSERAISRRAKATHIFDAEELQYLFLNNRGAPYFVAEDDPYRALYREAANGGAIRQFIATTLKKQLEKRGASMSFSFHDLRASFGMNLLDQYLKIVASKDLELSHALVQVKERMGHSSLEVTERYLNYRGRNKLKEQAQDEFELFMQELLDD